MRLKILRTPGSELLRELGTDRADLREGAEVEINDKLGKELLTRRLAEPVALKAVPKAPEIRGAGSVEQATADLERYRRRGRRETTTDNPAAAADSKIGDSTNG